MQRKAKLVKCASTIFALLIMGITTFAGGLLVTRASASLRLDNGPTCQLVKDTEEDAVLVVFTSNSISDELQDLLDGVNGTQRYGLQCKNPQAPPPMATPCIETSITTCVVSGTPPPVVVPNPNPTPTNPNPQPPLNVGCVPQNGQLVCSLTLPSGTITTSTANGPVSCTFQNNQIQCNGAGLVPVLKTLVGATLPPNGTISCGSQNGQIVCSSGPPGPNTLVSCTNQNGQTACQGTIPSNVSVGIPSNKGITCTNQNGQITCTASVPASGSNGSKIPTSQQASNHRPKGSGPHGSFCLLVLKGTGNTRLTLSSEIVDPLKSLLLNSDGTLKYSLRCHNI